MVVYTWFSHFCGFCAFLALLVTFEIQEKLAWKIQKYVLPSVKDLKDWPCLSLWMGEALEDPRQSRNETMTIRKYISIFENFGNVSKIFRNEIYLPNISKTPMLQKISKFWVIFWLSFWAKKKTPMALQWVWNRGKRAWRGLVRGGGSTSHGGACLFFTWPFSPKSIDFWGQSAFTFGLQVVFVGPSGTRDHTPPGVTYNFQPLYVHFAECCAIPLTAGAGFVIKEMLSKLKNQTQKSRNGQNWLLKSWSPELTVFTMAPLNWEPHPS